MNERYLQIFQNGMKDQLEELTLDEMVLYIRNHIHSFLMDETISFCFIERLANDPETIRNQKASAALLYLLDKAVQMRPFRPGLLAAVENLTRNPHITQRIGFMKEHNQSMEIYDQISALNLKTDAEDARNFITQLIQAHPSHITAAQFALHVDRQLGITQGEWREAFTCPPALRRDWEVALFQHHAGMKDYGRAMELWDKLKKPNLRETTLNFAAEMFVEQGDKEQALELYRASLAQDPRQTPIRLRIRELENPFVPDTALLNSCEFSICVYSWNKADMLGQTLESLATTDLGKAKIHILLNGCTDHSREEVDRVLPLFKNNEVKLHELHVNIGAPAARNWLMHLPEVQEGKYIAFIDDDVVLQKDWLAQFLTIAEADDQVAVVGCKIVHPQTPSPFQYLYRHVALATHGLLKLSIPAPPDQYDNGVYDVIRETRSVMGCQHLLRTSAVNKIPAGFDIRFSPSQVDDMDHDMALCLEGYKVMYCGTVTCQHHQGSGISLIYAQEWNASRTGNAMGNDIKFFFKHFDHMERMQALDSLSLGEDVPLPDF
ncbi:glycosyltransferase family A protein [Pseudodesulfovibrio sp. zrk46]|uniref:glycosyltransferase family A protein n=1 Tax=Pseudodesulfovibrio sp. zrk46 TaxID=2725288 RepID=UPI0014493C3E|nr:glycosyltransferase family A protein [Pseudodesulfovibrio sp. zrk46]QJB56289.1 glycosyltransferase family 2 protein [Pseudodesulfovibrio sp. zrk46]